MRDFSMSKKIHFYLYSPVWKSGLVFLDFHQMKKWSIDTILLDIKIENYSLRTLIPIDFDILRPSHKFWFSVLIFVKCFPHTHIPHFKYKKERKKQIHYSLLYYFLPVLKIKYKNSFLTFFVYSSSPKRKQTHTMVLCIFILITRKNFQISYKSIKVCFYVC